MPLRGVTHPCFARNARLSLSKWGTQPNKRIEQTRGCAACSSSATRWADQGGQGVKSGNASIATRVPRSLSTRVELEPHLLAPDGANNAVD
jgi:hypothetical protein